MRNINYNLIKLLHTKLDDAWRLEKHYLDDVEKDDCASCKEVLQKIYQETQEHIKMLKEEIARHIQENKFD